jgi:serine/threonine-protein kinase
MSNLSLGRYEVLARLSRGDTANLFLARSRGAAGFNRLVALKILRPELAAKDEIVELFLDEARMAARLRHPNCVEIYDLGRTGDTYFISMEYILGESLDALIPQQVFEAHEVAFILAAACDGLHHAHQLADAKGRAFELVHRDMSPDNLMVTSDGYTKIVDFGIAKTAANKTVTATGEIKGKPNYMSPEQISGREIDRRSDIFSMGIILWECLTGKRLFEGFSVQETMERILGANAPRVRDVAPHAPRELESICVRALERVRERRFSDAREMASALRNYLDRAWPGHRTQEIAQSLQDYAGETIASKKRAYEGLLSGTGALGKMITLLDAEPARHSDFLAPVEENTLESHGDTSIATVIEVEVSASGTDPDPTIVEPETVSPAWLRVPSLGIRESSQGIVEITHPELDEDDEETEHREEPVDDTKELPPRVAPSLPNAPQSILWLAAPALLAIILLVAILYFFYSPP